MAAALFQKGGHYKYLSSWSMEIDDRHDKVQKKE